MAITLGPLAVTVPIALTLDGHEIGGWELELKVVDGEVQDLRPVLAKALREAAHELEHPEQEDHDAPAHR